MISKGLSMSGCMAGLASLASLAAIIVVVPPCLLRPAGLEPAAYGLGNHRSILTELRARVPQVATVHMISTARPLATANRTKAATKED